MPYACLRTLKKDHFPQHNKDGPYEEDVRSCKDC